MKYKAALVGLGQVAYLFDDNKDQLESSLSHFSAYQSNDDVELVCGYSPISSEIAKFEEQSGIKATTDFMELLSCKPDIISICSPSENHEEQLDICIKHSIPMIWLEKPAAQKSDAIINLDKMAKSAESKSTILVNFFRRYHSSYQKLKQLINSKHFGKVHIVNIFYSKGISNNGIHMLDLIFYLFDDEGYEIIWCDSDSEENPSFILELSNKIRIFINGVDSDYHNIDIHVTASEGRMSILHGGMTTMLEEKKSHELFPEHFRLAHISNEAIGDGGFNRSFDQALSDLISSHENSILPNSNLLSSSKSQKLLEDILSFNKK